MSHKVCGNVECAIVFARKVIIKIERKNERLEILKTRKRLIELKPKSYWNKKAQFYFNRLIRMRDKYQLCISCHQPFSDNRPGGTVDAGHFRSIGSAPHLRFDALNCHAQCKKCNRNLSGNHSEYRKGLIERIGISKVEAIEADQQERKYTVPDLKEMIASYQKKFKEY